MKVMDIFVLAVSRMSNKPLPLSREIDRAAEDEDFEDPPDTDAFFHHLKLADPNDPLSVMFHQRLAAWDYHESPDWSKNTGRSTKERRSAIYTLLGIADDHRVLCDARFPYAPALDAPVSVVGDETRGWRPWYSADRQNVRRFYWKAYFEYVRDVKRWDAKNLAVLEESSKEVIERLQDPESSTPYQSKGLVVGYVQSGKTANFTGVIARAADAGYRLIIVLAGTINILREQTQRRLDKELLGKELCTDEPYDQDEDYGDFLSHHGRPSNQGAFDWERLTGSKDDYKLLKRGIAALEFHRNDATKPFFDPCNLHKDKARLLVVKKTPAVLDKLLKDLGEIAKRVDLATVPALIVDDESDQASINTLDPTKVVQGSTEDRTKTNKAIVNLLKLLPRGQYVGYTATPFANVFINPDDAEDLFPADYILSLPRPQGYMGMAEFYDESEFARNNFHSNEQAFIRFVGGQDQSAENLPAAIDAYVLAGAVKLHREAISGGAFSYRHHTMLIHNSQSVNVHQAQAREVQDLLEQANYAGGGEGIKRLRFLWETDHQKVSSVRGSHLPQPSSFEALLPYIGSCCSKLNVGNKPVRIINGNNKDDAPNFEKAGVWAILVGGTKLSRGYTVEGLTVSYYRRKAGSADTLMQMGRWFGFRPGYGDLVRLYIGNSEPLDRTGLRRINLYEAFRATCQDEEHFRGQLKRYASLAPGERITPKEVPPLVAQHLLPPTSKNKMFNAKLEFENLGGQWKESTVAPISEDARKENAALIRRLLRDAMLKTVKVGLDLNGQVKFDAITTSLAPRAIVQFLDKYEWLPEHRKVLKSTCEFLTGVNERDPQVDSWLFMYPKMQTKGLGTPWELDGTAFEIRRRSRIETGGRFKVYSEPNHRLAAEVFAGIKSAQMLPGCSDLRRSRQAVLLFYPVRDENDPADVPTMGFALLFPNNSIRVPISYTVRDSSRSDAVVVPKRN